MANRLGNVLEVFGWREEALKLFIEASEGRERTLGKDHKRTLESIAKVQAMTDSQKEADDERDDERDETVMDDVYTDG